MAKKKVPNPNGKNGGKAHRDEINKIEDNIVKRDLDPEREKHFKNKNGKSRFADIIAKDDGEIKEIYQVGKQNKNGTPIKRERDAMADIEKLSGVKVIFKPYNLIIIVALLLMAAILAY